MTSAFIIAGAARVDLNEQHPEQLQAEEKLEPHQLTVRLEAWKVQTYRLQIGKLDERIAVK